MTAPAGGYRQMPGGYDAAITAANGGNVPQHQSSQQPGPMNFPTQLGQQSSVNVNSAPVFSETQSPLQNMQPVQTRQPMPWERPAVQQQPVQQQQVQQQPTQQQQPQQTDLNQRVTGPNIPAELQGRTIGEIVGISNGLRQVHLQSLQQGNQQQAPAVVQQPQQPQQSRPNDPAAGTPAPFDWRNPEAAFGRIVDQRLEQAITTRLAPMLAPVALQGQVAQATAARNQAAAEIPNFGQIEPLVLERMRGIAPEALLNPDTWRVAAQVVMGDLAIQQMRGMQQGGQPQQGGQQQQAQPQSYQGAGVYPQQQVQPGQSPLPNLNGFFTEQPNQGGPGPQGLRLNAEQMRAADAMGMPHAEYAAWAGGVPSSSNGARR